MNSSPLDSNDGLNRLWAIIVSYNGMTWIERCVDSLTDAGVKKIIVVDNGSRDETVKWLQDNRPFVRIKPLNRNVGFGQGNNIGIQIALDSGAEWILLVNQDIICQPDSIGHLVGAILRQPQYGILSAFQLNGQGDSIDAFFRKYMPPSFYDDLFFGKPISEIYPVTFVPAAIVLMPRKVLIEVGGFDPLFFLYGEDDDLCHRIQRAGWKLGVVPRAIVCHWHGLLNREKSFSWYVNWAYSRAIIAVKTNKRNSTLLAYLAVLWRTFVFSVSIRYDLTQWFAKLLGYAICGTKLRQISKHRLNIPFVFSTKETQCASITYDESN